MRRIVMVLVMIVGAAPLAAQEPQCASTNNFVQASCQAAVDGIRAFYPLAGMVVTGGNPVIGTARSLGGLGHFALTARVNAIKAALPDPTATNQTPVPTSFNGALPAPVIEGAVGLTKGLAGGLLAVDVLGSALILPTGIDNLTVDANATKFLDAALGIGYGLRVGVLNGAFPVPAVSVSWMHRTVPRLRYGTIGPIIGTGDEFEFTMDLTGDSYRAIAGWKLAAVDLAAGIGVDRYRSRDTNIRFHNAVTPTSVDTVVINPTNTRALAFVNAGLSLAVVKLVGEIGLQAGKDQAFVTQFSDFDPKAAHVFGGVGVRFGF